MVGAFRCKVASQTRGAGGWWQAPNAECAEWRRMCQVAKYAERGSNANGALRRSCGTEPVPHRCREIPRRRLFAWAYKGDAAQATDLGDLFTRFP